MSPLQILFCFVFAALNICGVLGGSELARGFNEDIEWVTLDDGLQMAKDQNKMLFLLIHKSWCGACKSLKPQFTTSIEIEKMAKDFIMVNVMDDEEPKDRKFQPDGGYIPRIFFLTPDGEVQISLLNEGGNPSYKFYYPRPDDIIASMKRALSFHQGKQDEL